jgi:DNA replication protein DnaC
MTKTENVIEPTSTTGTSGEWTRERVFNKPSRSDLTLPPTGTTTLCFTDEFLAELKREKNWVAVEPYSELPKDKSESVGMGVEECPVCKNRRTYHRLHRGEVTGLSVYWPERCDCDYARIFWSRWKSVPPRFKDVTIRSLVARSKSQEEALATIRKHPNDSYLLMGAPGSGKTHFSFALYYQACALNTRDEYRDSQTRNRVWRIGTSNLLQQHVDWETRDKQDPNCAVPAPVVMEKAIQRVVTDKCRPSLFLDELDKITPSEFKLNRLRELIDAVYEGNGQVVATMNKTPKELAAKWGKDMAGTILRRIGGEEDAHTLKFE